MSSCSERSSREPAPGRPRAGSAARARGRSFGALLVRVLYALALAAGLGAAPAFAETTVAGPIEVDSVWTAAGSPYLVSGGIAIRNGAVLTVEPGVTVYMAGATGLTVEQGGVQAIGTAASPIQFLSDKVRLGQAAAPGDFAPLAFTPGTTGTRLEHVLVEHGSGLVISGAAPVLNFVEIRGNRGAAITIDLAASPTGVGNQASGNSLNGIAVPPGDITGSVEWGLRGIPYIVQTGIVSVGASPRITAVTPQVVERGETVTVTVDGSRLGGLASAALDNAGLAITPFSGGSSSRLSFQVKAAADAALGAASLRLQVDAGELFFPDAITVTRQLPAVTSVSPSTVMAGSGANELVVAGRNFNAQAEVLVNSAVVATTFVSSTELRATLSNQTSAASLPVRVRIPDPDAAGQYLTSSTSATLTVEMPVPPTVKFEPTPIAMPPDNKPHEIVIRLSKADFRDHTLAISISDPAKATVAPATITIPAGETTARIAITPMANGSVNLIAQSDTLGETRVPLYITPDYRGINTSYAPMVGVVVEGGGPPPAEVVGTLAHQGDVGVSVGSMLAGVSPRGWHRGSAQDMVVHGIGIPAGAQLALSPADGVTVGAPEIAADGTTLVATLVATADAAPGPRRVVVRDANGALLAFADPAASVVVLTSGEPRIDSVTPIRAIRNSGFTLEIRGENLHDGTIEILPADGLELDAQPRIDADGTLITAQVRVGAGAPLGDKVVRVATASGTTASAPDQGNTLRVVDTLGPDYLTAAPIVGVMVGDGALPTAEVAVPVLTSGLGVVVGASVTGVSPGAAVIGTTQTITVRGQGLQAVTGIAFTPAAALTVGAPTPNADGTELTFSLQVAADAVLGARRIALETADGPLAFADVMDGSFLISAPLAELDSVTPQVLTLGGAAQTLAVLGRNFTNASDIRVLPAEGITVHRPFTVSADGERIDVAVTIDPAAAVGTRTLVVTTPAGESTSDSLPGNSFKVASQVGAVYPAILSTMVGVVVGDSGAGTATVDGPWVAPLVGVMVEEPPPEPVSEPRFAVTDEIGVLVGAAATGLAPDGWLQGTSGTLTVTGTGLAEVTAATAMPADGLLLGERTVNAEGTELTIAFSVTESAALGTRRLRLGTTDGELAWMHGAQAVFGIGRVPTMNSVSPIVIESGTSTTLEIRGTDLQTVNGATLVPADGVELVGEPTWSQDALGELLQVPLRVDAAAPTGDRVLQLLVPGGATTTTPNAANTIKVVRP